MEIENSPAPLSSIVLPQKPLNEPPSTFSLYLKSPLLLSLVFSCLGAVSLPAAISLGAFGSALFTLIRYPNLLHKGFLYEVAIIDLIARDKITSFYPPVNHHWWHTISDDLILGGLPLKNYQHHKKLQSLGIKAVCSVLEDFETTTETFFSKPVSHEDWINLGIDQTLFSCVDMQPMNLNSLVKAVEWIGSHIMKKEKVYVHCKQGRGRSSCIVIGYLIRYENMNFGQAYQKLLQIRPFISIRPGQRQMLEEFEKWNQRYPKNPQENL